MQKVLFMFSQYIREILQVILKFILLLIVHSIIVSKNFQIKCVNFTLFDENKEKKIFSLIVNNYIIGEIIFICLCV